MQSVLTKVAAARLVRRHRLAEQAQAVRDERRRLARRFVPGERFRFPVL